MRPILFTIAGFEVQSFWVSAFAAFFFGFLAILHEVRRRRLGDDLAYDILLHAYVGGWVGARLFVIPSAWELFLDDPVGILLSGSGWVWYGGVIGGAVACWRLAHARGMPLLALADITSPALALGLAIGRIGCQLSGDGDYGIPTDLPWGMSYPEGVVPTMERVHPTPIYEMVACFGLYGWLRRRQRISPPLGDVFGYYLIASGVIRFLIEIVRRNPAWLLGLTTAQGISIGMIALGAWLLVRRRPTRPAEAPVGAV